MNCCNANGQCTQGADCAVRKVNDAYINGKIDNNPYDETLGSLRELITVIVVATAVGLLAYVVWGML
jgi:hypothetical protein